MCGSGLDSDEFYQKFAPRLATHLRSFFILLDKLLAELVSEFMLMNDDQSAQI